MTRAPAPLPPLAEPAAEFERHFQWRWWAMVGFLGLMLGLAAVALASLLVPPRILQGIPDDPDARAAWAVVGSELDAGLLELRFRSELGVVTRPEGRVWPEHLRRAERAETLLKAALRRQPGDPRLHTAIGHLDLVRQRPRHAERAYRAAIDLAPHHDEARLGLGVALARRAALEADPIRQRRLQLEAIAQFAAVRENSAVELEARYNRAALLTAVGRRGEARRWSAAYLAAAPDGPWAERLRAMGAAP
jgi:tetratricopeptide (TPR) repeat protein